MKGSKRFLGWLLTAALALLAVVMLTPLGMFIWNLERQRALQVALDESEGVQLLTVQSHWLADWLPESLVDRLPAEKVELSLYNDKGLTQLRNVAGKLNGIRALSIRGCSLTDDDWQAVFRERQLKKLDLSKTPITSQQLGQLPGLPHLWHLSFDRVPLTDEALVHFENAPSLTHMILHDTQVTLPAIERFAAAHPDITVGWNRDLTDKEERVCSELYSLGLLVGTITPEDYIAREYRWRIGWSDKDALTPRMRELLQELGTIEQIEFKGRLTPEALELLTSFPTIMAANCARMRSIDDVEKLASLPQIQAIFEVRFGHFHASEERIQAFFNSHATKLGHPRDHFPLFVNEE